MLLPVPEKEKIYVDEIRGGSTCDFVVGWICPCGGAANLESLSQPWPFSNLLRGVGQSDMCMPRYGRVTPVWALSFGAILPHL